MDSALSFLVGALLVSAKGLAFAALGFGIAWWRSRAKLRRLEAERSQVPALEERLDRLEGSLDYIGASLERLAASHDELRGLLSSPGQATRALPPRPTPADGSTAA